MEFFKHILSRGLPKTGQVTEFVAGDDATYQAGWWLKRLIATNRTRFVSKTIDGDVVVYDRATGLCWTADGNEAGGNSGAVIAWSDAIPYALALDFAGFTDWRIPNVKETISIANYGKRGPALDEPPFINTAIAYHWTSTTCFYATQNAFSFSGDGGAMGVGAKTDSRNIRCVRCGV